MKNIIMLPAHSKTADGNPNTENSKADTSSDIRHASFVIRHSPTRPSDTTTKAGTSNAAFTTAALGRAVHMDTRAVQLKYFTDPSILHQLGHNRVSRLFQDFERDLMDAGNPLPFPSSEDPTSLDRLAAAFGRTDSVPQKMRNALHLIEAAASPENAALLDSVIQRRLPCISLNRLCPLDCALELWFACPDELPKFESSSSSFSSSSSPAAPNSDLNTEHCTLNTSSDLCHSSSDVPPSPAPVADTPAPRDSVSHPPLSDTPPPTLAESDSPFALLALLSPAEYDGIRKQEAARLRLRVETLDAEVGRCRSRMNRDAALSSALSALKSPEPWPDAVDGNDLLIQVAGCFSRYLVLPPGAADAFALWTAHAHVPYAFPQSPRLNLNSQESGCGKTTSLDVLASLTPRPLRTENLTAPVLFRLVDQYQPTLLLDEVDTYLHSSEELRGLLNAGHKRGGCAFRCEGDSKAVRAFKAFGPAALAGIGPLPGTLHDRSICIPLVPAEATVPVRFDEHDASTEATLCRQLARWTRDNFAALKASKPSLPSAASNRLADNWRPLFAIACVAGGDWPERVVAAFTELTSRHARVLMAGASRAKAPPASNGHAYETQGLLIMLLSDIRQIFVCSQADRLASTRIVESLCALPDRPWTKANRAGRPITGTWLGRKLNLVGVCAHTIRIGGVTSRGYHLNDFADAFSRFLQPEA